MSEQDFIAQLRAVYWSAQTEKQTATERVLERGQAANASDANIQQHIQRTVEDIEHSMRMKLAAIAIQYIHKNSEPDAGKREAG